MSVTACQQLTTLFLRRSIQTVDWLWEYFTRRFAVEDLFLQMQAVGGEDKLLLDSSKYTA